MAWPASAGAMGVYTGFLRIRVPAGIREVSKIDYIVHGTRPCPPREAEVLHRFDFADVLHRLRHALAGPCPALPEVCCRYNHPKNGSDVQMA